MFLVKVALKYAMRMSGALCVMTSGALLMLQWLAGNWALLEEVCQLCVTDFTVRHDS